MVLQHWSLHTVLEPVAFGLITAQHVYSHNMPQSKRSLPPPAEGRWQTGWVPRPQSYTQSLEEIERFFFLHLLRSTITSLLPMTRRIHKAQPCLIIVILMVSQRRQICLCIICSFLHIAFCQHQQLFSKPNRVNTQSYHAGQGMPCQTKGRRYPEFIVTIHSIWRATEGVSKRQDIREQKRSLRRFEPLNQFFWVKQEKEDEMQRKTTTTKTLIWYSVQWLITYYVSLLCQCK